MYTAMHQLKMKVSKGERGFTLVELLIVVAIIGILAAIAIPQFAAYRLRSYNASSLSDMRNAKTSEEALFADWQVYGSTEDAAALPGVVGALAAGAVLVGPATTPGNINIISTTDNTAVIRGLQVATGNRIFLIASTDAAGASFTVATKHTLGDAVFGGDSDSTATYVAPDGLLAACAPAPCGVGSALAGGEEQAPAPNTDEFGAAGAPWVTR
jgi:prepilin-type N-terminal cleavage/methylation domain-containing protein